MTEYTTSPEAYQEYMSARDRCVRWVQTHSSDADGFYSPSIPPTEIEGLIPSSPPSDAGSSHSLPPKMVLRYNDGRPDIPIPYTSFSSRSRRHENEAHRSHAPSKQAQPIPIQPSHKSSQGPTSHNPRPAPIGADAGSPEEIRVLPSQRPAPSPLPPRSATSSHRQRSHHSRSKSVPRADPQLLPEEDMDAASSRVRPVAYPPPSNHHSRPAPQMNPQAGPVPWHGLHIHSSSSSTKHSRGHSSHNKLPPAIVYAPHHGHAPHYAPPAILYHSPPRGPNGMIYSHSAPVPIQGGQYPVPNFQSHDDRRRRDRTRSLGPGRVHKVPRSDDGRDSDVDSVGSGSTYYVLPTAGQKVHVIAPSPGQSVHTATSTTKSPGSSPKKPFFQRLFGFAKIGSSTGGQTQDPRKALQRRHSFGDSERPTAIHTNRAVV
ncbi:hypothetical protein NP233_g5070 [Leucocoprinus birnbaumii]|uniref:Uncharacterized protein n=1 Tax=Leucocoprinus birnbaumii TaxID=56174 RepID=A0AAD5VTH8_9AGAR|nr:hypothetical protein NP233_g5070 [Leucocoprinus birnbaumii]